LKALRDEFPAIEPWLRDYRDNLTFEMIRFRNFTEDAIMRGDLTLVRHCFQFLDKAFATGNRHLRNRATWSTLSLQVRMALPLSSFCQPNLLQSALG